MRNTTGRVLLTAALGAALIGGMASRGLAMAPAGPAQPAAVAPSDCGWDYDWDGDRDRDDYNWWYDRHRYHDYHDDDTTREQCEQ